jgi:hypothetical protein
MPRKQQTIIVGGGMNTADQALRIKPGQAILAYNYEVDTRGRFRRFDGFERFDGRPRPSDFIPDPSDYTDPLSYRNAWYVGAEARRAVILAVPGSGPVRGVMYTKDKVFAWRNNAGGTALVMHKATAGGWAPVVGQPALNPLTGNQMVRHWRENFIASGGAGARGIFSYIVDGANDPIEFDPVAETFNSFTTGSPGFPFLVIAYKNHLFLGYAGGNFIWSDTGKPADYTGGAAGAGEAAMPDEITDWVLTPGGTLAIFCDDRTEILAGDNAPSSPFQKQVHSSTSGAKGRTVQQLGEPIFLDNQDVTFLQRTQAFGDARQLHRCSAVLRSKGQYLLFLQDGTILRATFVGQQFMGWGTSSFGPGVVPFCSHAEEGSNDVERLFVGADNGFIYELEMGRSWDGANMPWALRIAFHHLGSPNLQKQFHRAIVEGTAEEDCEMFLLPDFEYSNNEEAPYAEAERLEILAQGSYYDVGQWDQDQMDRAFTYKQSVPIVGVGTNGTVVFTGESDRMRSHTIEAVSFIFTLRGRTS